MRCAGRSRKRKCQTVVEAPAYASNRESNRRRGSQKVVFIDGPIILQGGRAWRTGNHSVQRQLVREWNAQQTLRRPLWCPLQQIGDCLCGHPPYQFNRRTDRNGAHAGQKLKSRIARVAEHPDVGKGLLERLSDGGLRCGIALGQPLLENSAGAKVLSRQPAEIPGIQKAGTRGRNRWRRINDDGIESQRCVPKTFAIVNDNMSIGSGENLGSILMVVIKKFGHAGDQIHHGNRNVPGSCRSKSGSHSEADDQSALRGLIMGSQREVRHKFGNRP